MSPKEFETEFLDKVKSRLKKMAQHGSVSLGDVIRLCSTEFKDVTARALRAKSKELGNEKACREWIEQEAPKVAQRLMPAVSLTKFREKFVAEIAILLKEAGEFRSLSPAEIEEIIKDCRGEPEFADITPEALKDDWEKRQTPKARLDCIGEKPRDVANRISSAASEEGLKQRFLEEVRRHLPEANRRGSVSPEELIGPIRVEPEFDGITPEAISSEWIGLKTHKDRLERVNQKAEEAAGRIAPCVSAKHFENAFLTEVTACLETTGKVKCLPLKDIVSLCRRQPEFKDISLRALFAQWKKLGDCKARLQCVRQKPPKVAKRILATPHVVFCAEFWNNVREHVQRQGEFPFVCSDAVEFPTLDEVLILCQKQSEFKDIALEALLVEYDALEDDQACLQWIEQKAPEIVERLQRAPYVLDCELVAEFLDPRTRIERREQIRAHFWVQHEEWMEKLVLKRSTHRYGSRREAENNSAEIRVRLEEKLLAPDSFQALLEKYRPACGRRFSNFFKKHVSWRLADILRAGGPPRIYPVNHRILDLLRVVRDTDTAEAKEMQAAISDCLKLLQAEPGKNSPEEGLEACGVLLLMYPAMFIPDWSDAVESARRFIRRQCKRRADPFRAFDSRAKLEVVHARLFDEYQQHRVKLAGLNCDERRVDRLEQAVANSKVTEEDVEQRIGQTLDDFFRDKESRDEKERPSREQLQSAMVGLVDSYGKYLGSGQKLEECVLSDTIPTQTTVADVLDFSQPRVSRRLTFAWKS